MLQHKKGCLFNLQYQNLFSSKKIELQNMYDSMSNEPNRVNPSLSSANLACYHPLVHSKVFILNFIQAVRKKWLNISISHKRRSSDIKLCSGFIGKARSWSKLRISSLALIQLQYEKWLPANGWIVIVFFFIRKDNCLKINPCQATRL